MDITINKEKVLQELACIGFANAADYLRVENGMLLVVDTQQLSREAAAAVASVERGTGGLKIKLYDKLKALELLGKYLSLFDGAVADPEEKGLLESLLLATGEEVVTDAIPELQPPADGGAVLVEQTSAAGI